MISSILFGLPLFLQAFALPAPLSAPHPRSLAPRSHPIPRSDHILPIAAKVPRSAKRSRDLHQYTKTFDATTDSAAASTTNITTTVDANGPGGAVSYAVNITIGNGTFLVIADTGSSDLWLHASNLTCLNADGSMLPAAACDFGPEGFDAATTTGFQNLNFTNNFNITYGDGTFAIGYGGTDTVAIGNLSVADVEFAVVDEAYWQGDGVTDGLLGLASPLITSVYRGTDATVDSQANVAGYQPFFYKAVAQGLVAPYFSVALDRTTLAIEFTNDTIPSLGSFTFGGIPSNVPVTSTTVTVPNVNFTAPIDNVNVTETAYYTVSASSFNFNGSTQYDTSTSALILDTGTTLMLVPSVVAEGYAALIPSAQYSAEMELFTVDCTATMPAFSVTIGGVEFTVDPADMVFPNVGPDSCLLSLVPYGDSPDNVYILGDRFMVNVVATFNIDTDEITITQRENY